MAHQPTHIPPVLCYLQAEPHALGQREAEQRRALGRRPRRNQPEPTPLVRIEWRAAHSQSRQCRRCRLRRSCRSRRRRRRCLSRRRSNRSWSEEPDAARREDGLSIDVSVRLVKERGAVVA